MELFKWRSDYTTRVEELDEEHREIVRLINTLYNGLRDGEDAGTMKYVLDEMVEYTHSHFDHEERMMRRFAYPGYSDHKREHDSFRSTINDVNGMVASGVTGLGKPLLKMMREWLLNHILEVDGKYGQFFNDKGVV